MTSSESWNCDGIPKNGREYSGLGGEHPAHENYSLDCEICGLPRESQSSKGKSPEVPIPIKTIATVIILGVVAIAGGVTAYNLIAKSCEAGLEKVDGECIDPFLEPYQKATQQGNEAISLASNYQTVEDLKIADTTLSEAISELSQIPSEALVYPEVETRLEEYQQKRTEITSNIERETAAQAKLEEVATIAQTAKEQTEVAQSTTQLTAAKEKWLEAKNKLNKIDSDTLVTSVAQQYQSDYDQQIVDLDKRIATVAQQNPPRPSVNRTTQPKATTPPVRQPTRTKVNPSVRTLPQVIPSDPCAGDNPPQNCRF